MAHPTRFELVTSAFGEWIMASAETIHLYPIARYATEITKQIEFDKHRGYDRATETLPCRAYALLTRGIVQGDARAWRS
ncbi:hypothetical protein MPL3365_180195 [Mesorhizobium plurifarium]|uniref:Uncharacterized protein n=1 Tax=Mesorhizobium plurifarium TaxID=69974 RepID=A0A090G6Z8_MESPL|nr:hypothetical protein MPL3365_180195 [Mesorhizobium plurifarium]